MGDRNSIPDTEEICSTNAASSQSSLSDPRTERAPRSDCQQSACLEVHRDGKHRIVADLLRCTPVFPVASIQPRFTDPSNAGVPATPAELRRRGYAGPQVMGTSEILDVPPDGHCLFSCALAARDVERLRSLNYDDSGFLRSSREDRELRTACRRLREMVGGIAIEDGRADVVEQLGSANLPEGAVLTYVARWLGGTLLVTTEGASSEYDLLFGEGPLVCKLQLGTVHDGAGGSSPHFRLAGSWMQQQSTSSGKKRRRDQIEADGPEEEMESSNSSDDDS